MTSRTVMDFGPAPEKPESEPVAINDDGPTTEVIKCEQGSDEWHFYRSGCISSSNYHECRRVVGGLTDQQIKFVRLRREGHSQAEAANLAGYKSAPRGEKLDAALRGERVGDFSAVAKDYAFRLAIERESGKPLRDKRFETYDMRRGHELEPDARELHGLRTDLRIQRAGIVRTTDGKFAASADGLIDVANNHHKITQDGGSEYKAFTSAEKIRSITIERDLTDYMDQIQGCMWLTGRQWWHFALYVDSLVPAGMELIVFEVKRDESYIENMERDLLAFDRLVEQYREQIREVDFDAVIAA